jgi:hypothetical protein
MIMVNDDGTFRYQPSVGRGGYLVITSPVHPLVVLMSPEPTEDGSLNVTIPPLPLRSVTVILGPHARDSEALLQMSINGLPVPDGAFSRHQFMRNLPQALDRREPLLVRDIAANGAITVTRGPSPERLPPGERTMPAACSRPEFRNDCVTLPVAGNGTVTFD